VADESQSRPRLSGALPGRLPGCPYNEAIVPFILFSFHLYTTFTSSSYSDTTTYCRIHDQEEAIACFARVSSREFGLLALKKTVFPTISLGVIATGASNVINTTTTTVKINLGRVA